MLALVTKSPGRTVTPDAVEAEIAATAEEAHAARAEAERLAAVAAAELDDAAAETALVRHRAADRAARRAEARVPELRERLEDLRWQQRQKAFEDYRKRTRALAARLVT